MSRSSSIGRRSLSSSSISPRHSQCEDDNSYSELFKEAESIRRYIDSDFLSNLLLKSERLKGFSDDMPESPNAYEKTGATSDFDTAEVFSKLSENYSLTDRCETSNTVHETKDENAKIEFEEHDFSLSFSNKPTKIRIDDSFLSEDSIKTRDILIDNKAVSDPNSPVIEGYLPVSNIFTFGKSLKLSSISSPDISPAPSPTFSRSSFALNSQFLKSLSASTQKLLNSLAESSSLDEESSSSKHETEKNGSQLPLALPVLSHSTSEAITKLLNTTENVLG